ncbi:MAG: RrF2 family transcriptional regulator [Actinobacteria bacterium]|nr:RrF2 family transcriptional regulator [Actinomycetota bacterium]
MIRLSTKGRYGTRVMLELALNHGRGLILLRDIAERQEISIGYLEQIIPSLKTAGLVNSTRGAHGGYTLAKIPADITLKEIISALEGPLSLVECINDPKVCEKTDFCVTRDLWNNLGEKIDDFLETITLQHLVDKHRSKQKSRPLMYSI